ncbi:carboxypeptidase-like regulatory domain-containing protein, partial [Flavobacterium sp.]|uniref:carboxypeptidase-like regulatory domain-containing protein n=1 Tax=Flavobacterium sp. TaxID=239 RepID=UPI0038D17137
MFTIGFLSAQITTSSLSGKVTDGNAPVVEANVTLTHLPTNSVYETTTDKQGRFNLENLTVGGPYKITIKSMEIKEYTTTQIQLSLGENDLPVIKVQKTENKLEEVVVTGKKSSSRNGGTNISQTQINGLPNINR